jgi:hypothetical protein
MKPTYLYDVPGFQAAIHMRVTTESLYLDFKSDVNFREPGAHKEVARDIAQFANSRGGVLLVGISEKKDCSNGLKVAQDVVGITKLDVLIQQIEQAITNFLVPSTFRPRMVPITLPEGTVLAINIEPSRHLVYVCERQDQKHVIECLCRTNHGKEWMNPDEMEQHMMNGSRAAKLAFTEARSVAKEPNQVEVLGGVWCYRSGSLHHPQSGFAGSVRSTQEAWFELSGSVTWPIPPATCNITIPFDLLRSVWVSSDGKVTMLLSVRLLFDEKKRELTLEPL